MPKSISEGRLRPGADTESRALEFLLERGYRPVFKGRSFMGVQVDLVVRAPEGHFVLVEVKSEGVMDRGILSARQKRRLQRVQIYFSTHYGPTELLVLVGEASGDFLEIPVQE